MATNFTENIKKHPWPWTVGGIAVAGGIWYWRRQAAAAAVPASVDTIDPATGLPYSQEASGGFAAPGSLGGAVSGYGGSYYGSGNINGYDQYGNPVYSTGITGNMVYTTNADWAQAAENDLLALGVTQQAAATAITRILAGLTVTIAQQDLFMQAIGLIGQPPQGYPKPIKLINSPAQPGPPPPHPPILVPTIVVPNLIGMTQGDAYRTLEAVGLKSTGKVSRIIYIVTSQSPKAGTHVLKGSIVTLQFRKR